MPPTVVRYERHSFAVNFVPFGAGQFQNGQRRKGWLFLGAEAALGAVSVGAFATNLGLYGLAPHRKCNDPQSMGSECPAGVDRSRARGHVTRPARRPGRQRRPLLGGRDLGRHRRHLLPPARGAASGRRQGRARAGADVPGGRAPHVFAQRPRRRLGILKGNHTMATLKFAVPGKGSKVYRIHKKITSLGRSEDADVTLPDAELADSHVHIHFDGREFNLATTEKDAEVFVNGRKKNRHKLQHEDRIRIGSAEIEFSLYDQPVAEDVTDSKARRAGVVQAALRVQPQADGELRAARPAGPAAGRHDRGLQRRQGVPGADGIGRAGRQGRPQHPARDHLRRRPPAVRLDHRARRQDAQAADHLGRAQRRRVQELAVGREPEADVGDVRAAARARQHAGRHLRRQRSTSPSCSTSRTSRC